MLGTKHNNFSLSHRLTVVCFAILLGATGCSGSESTAADDSSDSPATENASGSRASEYISHLIDKYRLEADNEFLRNQIQRLNPGDGTQTPQSPFRQQLARSGQTTKRAVSTFLAANCRPLAQTLPSCFDTSGSHRAFLQNELTNVRARILTHKREIHDLQSSRRTAGQIATLLSPQNAPFLILGLLSMASLLAIVAYHERHEFRKIFNGAKAQELKLWPILKWTVCGLFFLVVLVSADYGLFENKLYDTLKSLGGAAEGSFRQEAQAELAELKTSIDQLTEENERLEAEYQQLWSQSIQSVREVLGPYSSLVDSWKGLRANIRTAAVNARMKTELATTLRAKLREELPDVKAEYQQVAKQTSKYQKRRKLIRGGAGSVILLLVFAGGVTCWRRVQNAKKKTLRTCPQCSGHLDDKETLLRHGARDDLQVWECRNVIRSYDEYGEEDEQVCGFKSMAVYQPMPKLSFPTLGVTGAGKTVWLAMAYRTLNNPSTHLRENVRPGVRFDRIETEAANEMEERVDWMMDDREPIDPAPTAHAQSEAGRPIPLSLVCKVRDGDPWGPSNILLNFLDFSGEIFGGVHSDLSNPQRQRALKADGYIVILDPTKKPEYQSRELHRFREHVQLLQDATDGQELLFPVAICVTKLDTLKKQPYSSPEEEDFVDEFYHELRRVDPTGGAMSLRSIRYRSKATAKLRENIWKENPVEEDIAKIFGQRYMFFPMAPYGLEDLERTKLEEKTLGRPFGVLEPLLWLLHMNGYPVLEETDERALKHGE